MKYITFFTSLVIWLAFDAATKVWVASSSFKPIKIIGDFLFFSYQKNTGIAFSISVPRATQITTSIVIIGILAYFAYDLFKAHKTNGFGLQVIFGIIIGGALGNLIDRIRLGYVVDFIALRPMPVFNIADVGITVGLVALFLITLNKKT